MNFSLSSRNIAFANTRVQRSTVRVMAITRSADVVLNRNNLIKSGFTLLTTFPLSSDILTKEDLNEVKNSIQTLEKWFLVLTVIVLSLAGPDTPLGKLLSAFAGKFLGNNA